jgi:ubiquinol oxidase
MVHYFEEEAVRSYTNYLELIDEGTIQNVPAPDLAIQYYKMDKGATLRDMIVRVREDEAKHASVNWKYSL